MRNPTQTKTNSAQHPKPTILTQRAKLCRPSPASRVARSPCSACSRARPAPRAAPAVRASFLLQRAPNGPAEIPGRKSRRVPTARTPRISGPPPLNTARDPLRPHLASQSPP